jgi:carbon monoxide dehydrogenase subunit G
MILEGTVHLPATQDEVWAAIWDLRTLVSWIDGIRDVRQAADGTFHARMEQQVGAVKASFDLTVTVLETEPPDRVRIRATGQDRRLASTLTIDAEIRLLPDAAGSTLSYRADMAISGRLGSLGHAVIRQRANAAEAEFARRAALALQADR